MSDTTTRPVPAIDNITSYASMADTRFYVVTVRYPGENARRVGFQGPAGDAGPVVMITQAYPDGMFVDDPSRFGEFGSDWVRNFFA